MALAMKTEAEMAADLTDAERKVILSVYQWPPIYWFSSKHGPRLVELGLAVPREVEGFFRPRTAYMLSINGGEVAKYLKTNKEGA